MMLSGVLSGGGEGGLQRGVPDGGALYVQQMQVQAPSDRLVLFDIFFQLLLQLHCHLHQLSPEREAGPQSVGECHPGAGWRKVQVRLLLRF